MSNKEEKDQHGVLHWSHFPYLGVFQSNPVPGALMSDPTGNLNTQSCHVHQSEATRWITSSVYLTQVSSFLSERSSATRDLFQPTPINNPGDGIWCGRSLRRDPVHGWLAARSSCVGSELILITATLSAQVKRPFNQEPFSDSCE